MQFKRWNAFYQHESFKCNTTEIENDTDIAQLEILQEKEVLEQLLLHKKHGNKIHKNLLFDIHI